MTVGEFPNPAVSALEDYRKLIVSDFLDREYNDPFWEERFGPGGRSSAERYANAHIDNLQIALRFDIPQSAAHHYHHLQRILIHRGVCTHLIKEMLDNLKLSIIEIIPEQWERIEPYLDAGYTGLAYQDPISLALTDCENSLAGAVAERLQRDPMYGSPSMDLRSVRYREVLVLISYLADAVEMHSIQIFESHLDWISSQLEQRGGSRAMLNREINLLSKEITRQLAPEHARRLRSLIRQVTRN